MPTTPVYPAAVAELLALRPVAPLGPGTPVRGVESQLRALRDVSQPCRAGLWLAFNFLDESHTISQTAEGTPDYDFWHAIMHRREPDAWNSKYWFRRVGSHPVFMQLREQTPALGYSYTTPEAFVDFCENARDTGSAEEEIALNVQHREWELLFAWCFAQEIA
jgi:hypothetical protein